MAVNERGEILYNYLEAYERDNHPVEPIMFDWNRVSDVTPVETDEAWFETDLYKDSVKRGFRCQRVIVDCPNPRHGRFKQVMSDPPGPRDYKCYHCITEEMNRVLSLRMKRDRDQAIH